MRRLALIAALLSGAVGLAACDTLAVRASGQPTPLFRVEDPEYAGKNRDFHTIVMSDGKTLGGHDGLAAATIAGLQRNVRFDTRFTATPQSHNRDFRVVLIFNPAPGMSGNDLCRLPAAAPRFAPAAELHLQGAFCRTGDVLTEADAYVGGVGMAGDARFQAMMTAFVRRLFPSRDLGVGDTPE